MPFAITDPEAVYFTCYVYYVLVFSNTFVRFESSFHRCCCKVFLFYILVISLIMATVISRNM